MLRRHLKSHMSVERFACDFPGCGQVFYQAETLERHRATHAGPTQDAVVQQEDPVVSK
jgi:uncharacterized Zn-finger protein